MKNSETSLNIMALTQGMSIDIMLSLLEQMKLSGYKVGHTGALVSYAAHFKKSPVVKAYSGQIEYIKEWEIVRKALSEPYDKKDLQKRESALSPAAVWNAIIGDRRLIYGKRAKFTQDYRVHFTDEQLWSIAYHFVLAYEEMLNKIKPDIIIAFTPVTFGEVLGLEIANTRNIPILQIHSTRIRNYFSLFEGVLGDARHILKLIDRNNFKQETRELAQIVLSEANQKGLIYEGIDKAIAKGRAFRPIASIKPLIGALYNEAKSLFDSELRNDHHDPGALIPWFYQYWLQPAKEKIIKALLNLNHPRFIQPQDLEKLGEYCFYPLHSEPEVALQILGRPYHKNQIELLRNLATSLPAGMKLVVKEHPRSMGLRPYSYYKQLFEIPNLYLIGADCSSQPIVKRSQFVAVISGTIGFEAIMMGKPVLILGHPKYEDVRGSMTRKCFNLFDMPAIIRELLEHYKYEPEHIENFICALIEGSVAIDLYSNLLQKPGRHSFQDGQVSQEDDLKKLAHYTMSRIQEVMA